MIEYILDMAFILTFGWTLIKTILMFMWFGAIIFLMGLCFEM